MKRDIYTYRQVIRFLGVNCSDFGNNNKNLSQIDCEFRKRFISAKAYVKFQEVFRKHVSSTHLLKIKDSFEMYYYFYKTDYPYYDGTLFFCIGPALDNRISEKHILDIIEENSLSRLLTPELIKFYGQLPVKQDIHIFEQTIMAVYSGIFGRELILSELSGNALSYEKQDFTEPSLLSSKVADTVESFYRLENLMMDAISSGNAQEALSAYSQQNNLTFAPRPGDPVENLRRRYIILNVLCRKAIEKGGVHPVYIDSISSNFAIRVASASPAELEAIPEQMIRGYCEAVRKFSFKNYPALIQNCLLYLEQHYADNPSLSYVAEKHFVSRQYLSSLFKRTTGKGFTRCLHECQLRHAAELLKNTSLPVAHIAECCGQKDVSYFTKLFREYYGVSPREYRK